MIYYKIVYFRKDSRRTLKNKLIHATVCCRGKTLKITAGILFFILSEEDGAQHILHGADRVELLRLQKYEGQKQTEAGVLYLYPEKMGALLFVCSKRCAVSEESLKMLSHPGTKEAGWMNTVSAAWIPKQKDISVLTERIFLAWNQFLQTQNEIMEKAQGEDAKGVLDLSARFLKRQFALVDRDMFVMFETEGIARELRAKLGEGFSDEIVDELIMSKDFHDVATSEAPFYYYMESADQNCYCVNISPDGIYNARLVVHVNADESTLPSGAEQIADKLAGVLTQMVRNQTLKTYSNENELLHQLCGLIAEGEAVDPEEIRKAAAAFFRSASQTYQVFCLEPYKTSGWETQMETTLPVTVRKLEQEWPGSCAVAVGQQILWLATRPASVTADERYAFYQQLLLFLRETVFRAGASSAFAEVAQLSDAFDQAKAALRTGYKKNPSYWFYRFDDYRLDYMIDLIRETSAGGELLLHPAIKMLTEYDKTHDSQLTETLRVFSEKGQNVTQAADALFVHRTTLFRRLQQIREMTGIHLEDQKEMLALQLSFYLLQEH